MVIAAETFTYYIQAYRRAWGPTMSPQAFARHFPVYLAAAYQALHESLRSPGFGEREMDVETRDAHILLTGNTVEVVQAQWARIHMAIKLERLGVLKHFMVSTDHSETRSALEQLCSAYLAGMEASPPIQRVIALEAALVELEKEQLLADLRAAGSTATAMMVQLVEERRASNEHRSAVSTGGSDQ